MQCHLKYELKYQFKLNDKKKYIFYISWNYLKWTDKRISKPIKIWRYYKLAEALKTLHWNIKLHVNMPIWARNSTMARIKGGHD
jgi:hypothetical protein